MIELGMRTLIILLVSIFHQLAEVQLSRTKLILIANMFDAIIEQIHRIIDNDIKNAYFHIRVILNTINKKMLKQIAAQILYRNGNRCDLQQNV